MNNIPQAPHWSIDRPTAVNCNCWKTMLIVDTTSKPFLLSSVFLSLFYSICCAIEVGSGMRKCFRRLYFRASLISCLKSHKSEFTIVHCKKSISWLNKIITNEEHLSMSIRITIYFIFFIFLLKISTSHSPRSSSISSPKRSLVGSPRALPTPSGSMKVCIQTDWAPESQYME